MKDKITFTLPVSASLTKVHSLFLSLSKKEKAVRSGFRADRVLAYRFKVEIFHRANGNLTFRASTFLL